MERRNKELTGRLWLVMLKEGGRWKPKDLAAKVRADGVAVSQSLLGMAETGYVRKFAAGPRFFVYAVTGECSAPRSVSVNDVAEALAAQPSDMEVPA